MIFNMVLCDHFQVKYQDSTSTSTMVKLFRIYLLFIYLSIFLEYFHEIFIIRSFFFNPEKLTSSPDYAWIIFYFNKKNGMQMQI